MDAILQGTQIIMQQNQLTSSKWTAGDCYTLQTYREVYPFRLCLRYASNE